MILLFINKNRDKMFHLLRQRRNRKNKNRMSFRWAGFRHESISFYHCVFSICSVYSLTENKPSDNLTEIFCLFICLVVSLFFALSNVIPFFICKINTGGSIVAFKIFSLFVMFNMPDNWFRINRVTLLSIYEFLKNRSKIAIVFRRAPNQFIPEHE